MNTSNTRLVTCSLARIGLNLGFFVARRAADEPRVLVRWHSVGPVGHDLKEGEQEVGGDPGRGAFDRATPAAFSGRLPIPKVLLPLPTWAFKSLGACGFNQRGISMAHRHRAHAAHMRLVIGLAAFAILALTAMGRVALAQGPADPGGIALPAQFIEIVPTEGRAPVHLSTAQVVRLGRVENFTTIDTAAWVQQRTTEPVEAIARRLRDAGQRLVALTDLSHGRVYLALDRIVLVRDSHERHAAGARAAIVMVGLRFNTDVAVRETAQDVMAAIRREGQAAPGRSPAGP
jgi:hypothetical protein